MLNGVEAKMRDNIRLFLVCPKRRGPGAAGGTLSM